MESQDPFRDNIHRDCNSKIDSLEKRLAQAMHKEPFKWHRLWDGVGFAGGGIGVMLVAAVFSWGLWDCWNDHPGNCRIENYTAPMFRSDGRFAVTQSQPWSPGENRTVIGIFNTVDEAVTAGAKAGCPNYKER